MRKMMSFKHTARLSSGFEMPLIGLGTSKIGCEQNVIKAVEGAINSGYRHIDTAHVYRNESLIGNVLKKFFNGGKIRREDMFITTKLPFNGNSEDRVEHFCSKSLAALQLDYVDLYYIHVPFSSAKTKNLCQSLMDGVYEGDHDVDLVQTWKAMENLVNKGLVRSIGISNFNSKQIQRICDNAHIKPASLQVECHAYLPQYELHEFCKKRNITVTAYAPLASPSYITFTKSTFNLKNMGEKKNPPELLKDHKVQLLSEKYKKSPAQILLRYLVQRGIAVIPKSSNEKRIKTNIEIFDFFLSEEDMDTLKSLQNGYRIYDFTLIPGFVEHPEYPFNIPY